MYWLFKFVLVGPIVRWLTRPRVTGTLPDGPVVLAANHLAEIDSLVLAAVLPRRVTFVAKSEYFVRGQARARWYGVLCRATGQIPIDRRGAGSADAALAAARTVLDGGGTWVIYPEGTRSPDGRLHRGHTGAMRVALRCPRATVVPVGIVGSRELDPPRRRWWRRGHVEVRLGEPLELSSWHARTDDPGAWREATDTLMAAILRLSEQTYVDRYARSGDRRREAA